MENRPPIENSSSATMKLQKYVTLPYPSGCFASGGFCACLRPMNSSTWLPQSANEWIASASMLPECV